MKLKMRNSLVGVLTEKESREKEENGERVLK